MKVCLHFDPLTKQCLFELDIPVYWPEWRWPPPSPLKGIRNELEGPMPEPWLKGAKVRPELASDLQALASIHRISEAMTEHHRDAARQFVRKQVDHMDLPEGMRVLF